MEDHKNDETRRITKFFGNEELGNERNSIEEWVNYFLEKCRSENLSPMTVEFYKYKLKKFKAYSKEKNILYMEQITANHLRSFFLCLGESGEHNEGGILTFFRSIKAFLIWYEKENDISPHLNPIRKIKTPKVPKFQLDPVSNTDLQKLLAACGKDFYGRRDLAIFTFFIDTGVRANELVQLNVEDVDVMRGQALIHHGKGNKERYVFIGKTARMALRRYLYMHPYHTGALFINRYHERVAYDGIRAILARRCQDAKIGLITPHALRRTFAISMLRNGADVFSLQLMMGHEGLQVLRRYLKQTTEDLQSAHYKAGPLDHLGK